MAILRRLGTARNFGPESVVPPGLPTPTPRSASFRVSLVFFSFLGVFRVSLVFFSVLCVFRVALVFFSFLGVFRVS